MQRRTTTLSRRQALAALAAVLTPAKRCLGQTESGADTDPLGSLAWPDLRREFLQGGPVHFDPRVEVRGPAFAEDPMNVPITVSAAALPEVEMITVLVDRNPIRKVLEYFPLASLPSVSFRFKLEQASPVRAAARTRDGHWHVGGVLVDSTGGGCTETGASRTDPDWARHLGEVSARFFPPGTQPAAGPAATRLKLIVRHPMDTGLVRGIPAFYVKRLALLDAADRELMRLHTFEPVSENPVFGFDFGTRPAGPLRIVGIDNNGNRIQGSAQ